MELLGALGVPQLYIAGAALAVANELNVPLQEAASALANKRQTPGRLQDYCQGKMM